MKILLVNPPRFHSIPVIREERCEITERYSVLPPYSLLQIGALLRAQKNQVALIDANGEDLTEEELEERINKLDFDVIIFRFTPTTFDLDMKVPYIAKKINPNIVTIGICWTMGEYSNEVLNSIKELDIFIRHEYEVTVPALISALKSNVPFSDVKGIAYRKNKNIFITNNENPIDDYNKLPIPAYDLLPNFEPYFINTPSGKPFTIMYTSKGCPFNCSYCTVAKTKWKSRNSKNVIKELKYLKKIYNIHTVSFFDETFTLDTNRVEQISNAIIKEDLDIKWYCNTRVSIVNKQLLKDMSAGGCRGISYGIESGSQKILNQCNKRTTIRQAEDAIRWTKEVGIKVYCSFIFGLPGETNKTIAETIHFVRRTRPTGAQFNVMVPYPGTKIYEDLKKQGKINDLNWRNLYQHKSLVGTESLSPEELDNARIKAYRALYFNPFWIGQNILYVIKHPDDFGIASQYVKKIISNFFIHRMRHAH
jgi:radical SAM superfamily enzyme YgiQ (UPF0313 family)